MLVSGMSLFWRVFAINAAVLVSAAILLIVTPATISPNVALVEALVLAGGVAAALAVNLFLMRRAFGPLERLTQLMARVDPMRPGKRVATGGSLPEVAAVAHAFNEMLDRLESERRDSGRRALAAQEDERRRVASDLHDEVGQTLTGVVLQLETLARVAPAEVRDRCSSCRSRPARGSSRCATSRAACVRRRWTSSGCARRSSASARASPSGQGSSCAAASPPSCRRCRARWSS